MRNLFEEGWVIGWSDAEYGARRNVTNRPAAWIAGYIAAQEFWAEKESA